MKMENVANDDDDDDDDGDGGGDVVWLQLQHWMSTGRVTTRLRHVPQTSASMCVNWHRKNRSKHSRVTQSVSSLF